MDYQVEISREPDRLCGYRKPDKSGVGIYLIGAGNFEKCERLPWPLAVCPACGEGIRPARSYRWINPVMLFNPAIDPKCDPTLHSHDHWFCPICNPNQRRALLMWIGEKFYRTCNNFQEEAKKWGISKKMASLPNGFEIGKTGVFLAHKRAILEADRDPLPGVFSYFVPQGVDLVVEPKACWGTFENKVIETGIEDGDIPERALRIKSKLGDKARIIVVEPLIGEDQSDVLSH